MGSILKIEKIKNQKPLSKRVYNILKVAIVKGDLKAGTQIIVKRVASQLGVSETPVREALHKLVTKRLIKNITNKGMFVNGFSVKDIQDIFQVREVLEGLAASLAAKKISKEKIRKLEKILKQMNNFAIKGNILAFSEMDEKFHSLILSVSGNMQLIKIYSNLNDYIYRFRIRSLRVLPGRLKICLEEHLKVLVALKRGDSEQAERLSRQNICNALNNILLSEVKWRGKVKGMNKDKIVRN